MSYGLRSMGDLKLNKDDFDVLQLISTGSTLKEAAAALGKTEEVIKTRMTNVRKKNRYKTTEQIMFKLGRSGQLDNRKYDYVFPIGIA